VNYLYQEILWNEHIDLLTGHIVDIQFMFTFNFFIISLNMKKIFLLFLLLFVYSLSLIAQGHFYKEQSGWLLKAEENTPLLTETVQRPVGIVKAIADDASYQGWKTVVSGRTDSLYAQPFKSPGIIMDFGEHLTGYVTLSLSSGKKTPDSPAKFKLTFGEMPCEMAVPFDPFPGTLSRAWMQDETITVETMPCTIEIPRRVSFRYMKIEVEAWPSYDFYISDITCRAQTSASVYPEPLPQTVPGKIKRIEEVALLTLKECMQTVYEDGPKRDRRLWIGDLYLESMGNNYSFRQFDLTKRCLYAVAGIAGPEGFLHANAFEKPTLHPQANQYLYEYSLLFNATLKDYLLASGDKQTAEDLWPVAKRQLEIVRRYINEKNILDFGRLQKEWWVFIDWKEGLYKEVAAQGVAIFALKETLILAEMLGKEKEIQDVPGLIKKMTSAVKKEYYDRKTGLFISQENPQVSYASQIWMVLSGVATVKEGRLALQKLQEISGVCRPGTPYLFHYYIQSLIDCGLEDKAREEMVNFWGGMIDKGADTFWEAYDPQDDFISPYNFYPLNSYCHAWSCTPVYFIRKYPRIFQQ